MKKIHLVERIDKELLESLTGYSYKRTRNSQEAEELCSDIVFEIIKASKGEGDITNVNAFIWSIAQKTYADFVKRKAVERQRTSDIENFENCREISYCESFDKESNDEQIHSILREISFLTKAYREVMISYYLNGKSTRAIASEQGISENTVRQRLFSAREAVRKGVNTMDEKKTIALKEFDYDIIGTGNPSSGDPRVVAYRLLSKHVVWLCRNKAVSAKQISEALGVPMPYIENELECQAFGENGKYGLLKRLDNGKYTTNFILLDEDEIREMWQIYIDRLPLICDRIKEYVTANEDRYMSFPYLNKKYDFNLVLWQHVTTIATRLESLVRDELENEYFKDIKKYDRPFSVFGYRKKDDSIFWGCGHDGIHAKNICGYSQVNLDNIYLTKIKAHFHCGHDISNDQKIQLALNAIKGIKADELNEDLREAAAKAVEEGYIYVEDGVLYTKILTASSYDRSRLYDVDNGVSEYFKEEAKVVAGEIAKCIKRFVPEHLLCDYPLANMLAAIPIIDLVVENLIKSGLLTAPENGIGAEGCSLWVVE